jgi:hypothetical protein
LVNAQKVPAPTPQKVSIRFYPNPASTVINFDFGIPIEKGYTLQVFSFLGRNISITPVNSSKVSINVSEYFKGVYVFQLRDADGRIVASNKFQVSR